MKRFFLLIGCLVSSLFISCEMEPLCELSELPFRAYRYDNSIPSNGGNGWFYIDIECPSDDGIVITSDESWIHSFSIIDKGVGESKLQVWAQVRCYVTPNTYGYRREAYITVTQNGRSYRFTVYQDRMI